MPLPRGGHNVLAAANSIGLPALRRSVDDYLSSVVQKVSDNAHCFPLGPSSNGEIWRRRREQIIFGRLKVPVPANPKTDKTHHYQDGSD
jgi:hypothetical protein